ncbi:MAG TPA: TetR/AcrR family transcriptional regulator [Candidatus Limnocylindrales bacterium]|nr:TetR/AcrR family transcriptional regulator [Candidatus Limnocylindrales bacterium]
MTRASSSKAQHILAAATSVFARLGFGPARMDDVAAEAGVSKGGVYLYYKGKDELIDALVGWLFERETKRLADARTAAGSVEDRLVRFVHGWISEVSGMRAVAPVVLEVYLRSVRNAHVRAGLERFLDAFEEELAGLIGEGIASGEFRPVDARMTAVQLTALLEGLTLFWLIVPDRIDLVPNADGGIHLLLDGLRARPAPEPAQPAATGAGT